MDQEKKMEDILKEIGEVAEGVFKTEANMQLGEKHDIYTPIASEVKKIIKGKNPNLSLRDLLE